MDDEHSKKNNAKHIKFYSKILIPTDVMYCSIDEYFKYIFSKFNIPIECDNLHVISIGNNYP